MAKLQRNSGWWRLQSPSRRSSRTLISNNDARRLGRAAPPFARLDSCETRLAEDLPNEIEGIQHRTCLNVRCSWRVQGLRFDGRWEKMRFARDPMPSVILGGKVSNWQNTPLRRHVDGPTTTPNRPRTKRWLSRHGGLTLIRCSQFISGCCLPIFGALFGKSDI